LNRSQIDRSETKQRRCPPRCATKVTLSEDHSIHHPKHDIYREPRFHHLHLMVGWHFAELIDDSPLLRQILRLVSPLHGTVYWAHFVVDVQNLAVEL